MLLDAERGTLAFVKDGDDFNVGRAVVANLGTAYRQLWRAARDLQPGGGGGGGGARGGGFGGGLGGGLAPAHADGRRAPLFPCFGVKGDRDQARAYFPRARRARARARASASPSLLLALLSTLTNHSSEQSRTRARTRAGWRLHCQYCHYF